MKDNLLLLKDSLEQRIKLINTWLQYQRMSILINQMIKLINNTKCISYHNWNETCWCKIKHIY